MAHFAQINDNNIVTRVIVVNNEDIIDENGNESEEIGRAKLKELYGGRWIQTSYNSKIRRVYAGIGWIYDEELDIFIGPSDFPSWTLNRETFEWEPPVPKPQDDGKYIWNEGSQTWIPS